MFKIDTVATVSVLAAFTALSVVGSIPAQADCTAEWAEDVGLPSPYVPRVMDFASYNDGSGETLYAAGLLEINSPTERAFAVRWTGETWEGLELQETHPDEQGSSKLLAVFDDELYGAGGYRIYDPNDDVIKSYRVVRWDPTAMNWIPVSDAIPQFSVSFAGEAMVVFDGALYIGGFHDASQGIGPGKLSRFDGNSWGPPPVALPIETSFLDVRDLIVFNGELYASFGSQFFAGNVFKLPPGGTFWEQVGGAVPTFSKLAVFQDQLYIAGTNSQFLAPIHDHVLRLVDGQWEPIPSASNYSFTFIESMTSADDGSGEALFVGGRIRDIGGAEEVNNVAKWDGENWSALGAGTFFEDQDWDDAIVDALYGWNGALWLGGEFSFVGTGDVDDELIPSVGIARWACLAPPVDPTVSTVVTAESAVSSFGGTTRITVTPRTADGEMLDPGQDVVLSVDAGTLLGSLSDQGDGTYRQYLEGEVGSNGTEVRAVVNGVELDDRPFVSFVPVEPSLSTIDLNIDQTYLGGTAIITVTLLDDQGVSAGGGFSVQINTTLGELVGSVVDHGDGTYSQSIIADETGTASITATADGMALNTSAALSVLDPSNLGNIIGLDAEGNPGAFLSIQAAIDAGASIVFITPGTYNETILLDGASDLVIEGLSAFEPVTIRGVVVSESNDVSLRYLTIDPEGAHRPADAVEIRGGSRASDGVVILGSTIVNAANNGVSIDGGNANISIIDSVIQSNGRNGVEFGRNGEGHLITGSTISENGWTGVEIDRDVFITLQTNLISDNGAAFNSPNPNGHGISRARQGGGGAPEEVTLIQNTFENNNGRLQPGRSDADIRNYDQVIDSTDDQSPYTD